MLHLPRKVLGGHPSPRRQSFRPTVGDSLRAYERAYNEYLLFPFPGNPRRIVTVVIVTANTIEVKACEQPLTTLFTSFLEILFSETQSFRGRKEGPELLRPGPACVSDTLLY